MIYGHCGIDRQHHWPNEMVESWTRKGKHVRRSVAAILGHKKHSHTLPHTHTHIESSIKAWPQTKSGPTTATIKEEKSDSSSRKNFMILPAQKFCEAETYKKCCIFLGMWETGGQSGRWAVGGERICECVSVHLCFVISVICRCIVGL